MIFKDSQHHGWWLPFNARKAHYIVNSRSLCGSWGYFGDGSSLTPHEWDSQDDCKACSKKLHKEIDK